MVESGPDPALLAKLDALAPRDELVMRLALREKHDSIRGDRDFSGRIKRLLEQIDPRPSEMAAILAEAREAQSTIATTSDASAQAVPRGTHRKA